MGWPLFYRTATGDWQPVFGALSEFAGGLVMYAAILVAPGYLVLRGLRQRRAGRACYTRVIVWAAAMWPVLLICSMPNAYPKGSPEHHIALLACLGIGIPYVIYGLARVLPIAVRDSWKRRSRQNGGQSTP